MNIYKITNITNNKCYIGQTIKPIKERFREHISKAKFVDTKFYRALNKYGEENFKIELIDTASNQNELNDKEVHWIRYYEAVEKGYNSNDRWGKIGGDTLTGHPNLEEISKKISDSKIGGKNPKARKIKAIDVINNKEYIYDSYAECVRELNFTNHTCISKRCLGIITSPYKKQWLFEYID